MAMTVWGRGGEEGGSHTQERDRPLEQWLRAQFLPGSQGLRFPMRLVFPEVGKASRGGAPGWKQGPQQPDCCPQGLAQRSLPEVSSSLGGGGQISGTWIRGNPQPDTPWPHQTWKFRRLIGCNIKKKILLLSANGSTYQSSFICNKTFLLS